MLTATARVGPPAGVAGVVVAAASSAPFPAASEEPAYILRVSVSPCGAYVAAAASDGAVRVYESATLRAVCACTLAGAAPRGASSSSASAASSSSGGATLRDMTWRAAAPGAAAASSPLSLLLAGDLGGLQLIGVPSGRELLRWSLPSAVARPRVAALDDSDYGVYAAAVSADGSLAAVALVAALLFFDLRAAPPALLGTYAETHSEAVTRLAFHPRRPRHVVSAGEDGLLCLLDTAAHDEADALAAVCNADAAIANFGFCRDARLLWLVTRAHALSLWDLDAAVRVAHIDAARLGGQLAAEGRLGELLGCREAAAAGGGALQLLGAGADGELHVWALTLALTPPPPPPPPAAATHLVTLCAHSASIRAVDWAELAWGAGDGDAGALGFSAGEDGALVQWADEAALAALRAAPQPALRVRRMRHSGGGGGGDDAAGAGGLAVAALFGVLEAARPVSPPATNGSGTAAAAFLFGEDNAGDGSAINAAAARAMQEAAGTEMEEDGGGGGGGGSGGGRAHARRSHFGGGGGGGRDRGTR